MIGLAAHRLANIQAAYDQELKILTVLHEHYEAQQPKVLSCVFNFHLIYSYFCKKNSFFTTSFLIHVLVFYHFRKLVEHNNKFVVQHSLKQVHWEATQSKTIYVSLLLAALVGS